MATYRTTNRDEAEDFCLRLAERGFKFDRSGLRRCPLPMTYRTHMDPGGRFVVVYAAPRKQRPRRQPTPCGTCAERASVYSTGECKRCFDARRYREDEEFRQRKLEASRKSWAEKGKKARLEYTVRRKRRRWEMRYGTEAA